MAQSHLPPQLDACDPQFLPHLMAWSMETKAEIDALVAATNRTIANSITMNAEADHLLARR